MGQRGLSMFGFRKKKESEPFVAAVIPAGGSSSRMGENKLLMDLGGMPVLIRTLQAFLFSGAIREVVVACREADMAEIASLCALYGLREGVRLVRGGDTRQRSVLAGVMEVSKKAEYIAIHDGARPLVEQDVIARTVEAAISFGAAAPAVAVKDTIKEVTGGVIVRTLARERLFAVQTPQVFDAALIKAALVKAEEEQIQYTDDCAAAEAVGMAVHIVEGDYENIKLTTPEDIIAAEAILAERGE